MFSPLSPQTNFNPQVTSFPNNGQAVQQGGSPQTGQWSGLGSVTHEPNTQNHMQSLSFPAQGPGHRTVSEWVMRPIEQQFELVSQAASERNQAYRDNFNNQQQLFSAYSAVREQIEPLRQEIARLQDELSQKPGFTREALSSYFERMQVIVAQHGQLLSDNLTQVKLLEESNATSQKAIDKLNENTDQINLLFAKVESLNSNKEGLENTLQELKTVLANTQGDCEILQTALNAAEAKAENLERQVQNAVETHRSVLTRTQEEVNRAEENVGRLEALLARSADSLQESQTKVSSLTSQLTRLEHEYNKKDTEIQSMEASIAEQKVRGDRYKTQVDQCQQLLAKMFTERDALHSELEEIKDNLHEAKASADHAKLQYQQTADGLGRQLESAMSQLQEAKQAHREELTRQEQLHSEDMRHILRIKEKEITNLQTEIDALSGLLEQTKTQKSQLEGQLVKLQDGIGQEEAEALRLDLAEKDTTIQRLDGEISRLKGDLDSQKTDHDQALRDLRSSHGEEVGHLARGLQSARDELGLKEQNIVVYAETVGKQGSLIEELRTMNSQALEQAAIQKDQTNHQLGELQRKLDIVWEQNEMNTKKVEEFGTQLSSCISRLEQALNNSQFLATVLEEFRELNTEFHGERGLKHSNGEALSALNSLQSQISAFQQKASDNAVTLEQHSQERSEPFGLDRLQLREHAHSQGIQSVSLTRNRTESMETYPSTWHTLSMSEAGPRQVSFGGVQGLDLGDRVRNLDTSGSSSDPELVFGQQHPAGVSQDIEEVMRSTSPTV